MKESQQHGAFQTWAYFIPSKKPRGFWHGGNALDMKQYAWAPVNGQVCELSKSRNGFASRVEAVASALKELGYKDLKEAAFQLCPKCGAEDMDGSGKCCICGNAW